VHIRSLHIIIIIIIIIVFYVENDVTRGVGHESLWNYVGQLTAGSYRSRLTRYDPL